MAPSQLTQLKAALSSAGLDRRTPSKKDKKAFKKGGSRETDRAKKLNKLEEIRKGLNKFDERETKVKHDVGGRNLKGVTGRPSASKSAGLEQRKKSLLPEHQLEGHTGTFRDRRFGEANPSLSIEDRMLERYTRERQRGQGKKGLFNLEDDEDGGLDGFDDGFALGGLTHGGRSVMDLPGDDFEAQGFGERDEDEDDKGRIDRRIVSRGHFGGFEQKDEDEEEMPERKKSKAEVMSEVIAKSKEYKYERQQQREQDDELRDELDDDLDDLRLLLQEGAPARPTASNFASTSRHAIAPTTDDQGDYDQVVRSLAFDARAKPKNRTKTEEEQALEEKEKLEQAEAKRLRRMRGESVSDDENSGSRKKRKTDERKADADDLGDDFVEDEALLGPGLTREDIEGMASGDSGDSGEEDEDGDEDEEDPSGEEGEEEGSAASDEDDANSDEESEESAMEDLDEAPELSDNGSEGSVSVVRKRKSKSQPASKVKEIPYTFPCPSGIEEFEDIMDGLEDSALPVVVQRIRALHHPSLLAGNKEKLQAFLGVLLDHTLILASRPVPSFNLISSITPHIIALVKLNPATAASHFIEKIKLLEKNLTRGLSRGASRPESKTFPGCPELVLLRLVGAIWSTSDFSHPVVAPAVLLIGQYLGQSRIRSVSDIASGLFLCTLLAQFEAMSKRLLPEAVNFVGSTLLALLPRRKGFERMDAFPDATVARVSLHISSNATFQEPMRLADAINSSNDDEQQKANVLAVALRLVDTFAGLYTASQAFIEVVHPLARAVEGSRVVKLSKELKELHSTTLEAVTRRLTHAKASRQPLTMQSHKPIPIASYAPRFESDFAPGRHYDPDVERNSSAKLKALYKKERKGAIRELRKDNKFLAGEKAREREEKDKNYNSKMRKVEGEINMERAEEKAMEREKAREKRRAGRS